MWSLYDVPIPGAADYSANIPPWTPSKRRRGPVDAPRRLLTSHSLIRDLRNHPLDSACPDCGAPAGKRCRGQAGKVRDIHAGRKV